MAWNKSNFTAGFCPKMSLNFALTEQQLSTTIPWIFSSSEVKWVFRAQSKPRTLSIEVPFVNCQDRMSLSLFITMNKESYSLSISHACSNQYLLLPKTHDQDRKYKDGKKYEVYFLMLNRTSQSILFNI